MTDVEPGVAEAVDHEHMSDDLPLVDAWFGQVDDGELARVEWVAGIGELGSGGQVSGHRGKDVAAVKGGRDRLEAVWRARDVHHPLHAAAALPGEAEQPIVGTHEHPPVAGAQRERAPFGAHLRVDHGEMDPHRHVGQRVAQHQGALPHRVAPYAVGDVEDVEIGPDPADHPVAHPHEVVVASVVREQGDDHEASSVKARTSPSRSCWAASTSTRSPSSRAVALVIGPIDTTLAASGTLAPEARKKRTVELEVKVT